jgi:hypothetical protein
MAQRALLMILGLLLAASSPLDAADEQLTVVPGTLLITNAVLIDETGEKDDVVVNILLEGGMLEMVTQDNIPVATVELALDAQRGFLIGTLDLGPHPRRRSTGGLQ